MQHRQFPNRAIYILGAVAVFAVAACTSSSSTTSPGSSTTSASASSKMGTQPLVVETAELSPLTKDFNPLTGTASTGWNLHATDLIYEPLFLFNLMEPTQAPVPMLATNYSWSADGKTLTLTTRSGVKWTDGQAFSAADVAFTFNLIKKYAATADVNGTRAAPSHYVSPGRWPPRRSSISSHCSPVCPPTTVPRSRPGCLRPRYRPVHPQV